MPFSPNWFAPKKTQTILYPKVAFWDNGSFSASVSDPELTLIRNSLGDYTISLLNPHPLGDKYHFTFTYEQRPDIRDALDFAIRSPNITTSSGRTANYLRFFITTGDNGGNPDTLVDPRRFSVAVYYPVEVVVK